MTGRSPYPLIWSVLAGTLMVVAVLCEVSTQESRAATTFDAPTCDANGHCTTALSVRIDVPQGTNLHEETFFCCGMAVPVHIRIEKKAFFSSLILRFQETLYNVYEHFVPDELCPISFQGGSCRDEATRPPTGDGAEDYVLCCLNAPRGNGQHCLRYNYSEAYDLYIITRLSRIDPEVELEMTVWRGEENATLRFLQHGIIPGWLEATASASVLAFRPALMNILLYMENAIIARDTRPGRDLHDSRTWFVFGNADDQSTEAASPFNLPASFFRLRVTCDLPRGILTHTHTLADQLDDQFAALRPHTIATFFEIPETSVHIAADDYYVTMNVHWDPTDATTTLLFRVPDIPLLD